MAQRRMFSPDIVCSDAFLDMPASSQALYYLLGMRADDDGFVNPRGSMRMVGASEDDLKILVAKRFVLPFENGVVVIKHWRVNNLVRKDWYKETIYIEQKAQLQIKGNGAYTELVNEPLTPRSHRLGKVRLGKVKEEKRTASISYLSEIPEEDIKEFTTRFQASVGQIKSKAEDLKLYCESRSRVYRNYKAFLLKALKKDFSERRIVTVTASEPPKIQTQAQKDHAARMIQDIKNVALGKTIKHDSADTTTK